MVTIEATTRIETNIGTLNPGDMIDCHHVDIDNENGIISCCGINETCFDLPINSVRIIPQPLVTLDLVKCNDKLICVERTKI